MSETRPATQETPRTLDDWERGENEQTALYKDAIGYLLQARERTDDKTIKGGTVLTAAEIAYPGFPTDRFAVFGVLQKAVQSGFVLPEEVGGKKGVIYEPQHAALYMLSAEQRGEIIDGPGAYMHPIPSGDY